MLAPTLFSLIGFLAVLFLCFTIYLIWQKKQDLQDQSQRLEQAVTVQSLGYSTPDDPSKEAQTVSEANIRRDTRVSSIPWLNQIMSKLLKEKAGFLMILIEQSGLKIKVSEFLLFSILIAFIGLMIVGLLAHIPLVGIVAGIIPFGLLHILKAKRLEAFTAQMPQALDMLSSDLRAGLDVQAGLKHLSEEFSPPIGEEFGKIVIEVNLGLALNEALNNLSTRINTTETQILCTGIIINRELGGNLSELIGSVANTVRERFRLKGMIKALTAENQMSGYLLIALPFALFIILSFMAPETYRPFLSDPIGKQIVIGCLVSMTLGYLIMNKITQIEV